MIDVMSYYLQLKDHSFSWEIKIPGKCMQVLGAYEESVTLHVLLSCHSNLREVLFTKMMKAVNV